MLTPLGADLRHHDHLLSAVVHALLVEDDGARRLVRVTLSAWKVDAIAGPEVFTLLEALAPELVAALATPVSLRVDGATLCGGDLLWDGRAKVLGPASPFAVDLAGARLTAPLPRDRHPLQLAVPLVLGDGATPPCPIDLGRVSPHAELGEDDLAAAKGLVGLLRYDDGFTLQPLAAGAKKGLRGPAEGIAKAGKLKERAMSVLAERASRLLRKS